MDMYVVLKVAIYNHDIFGVFDNRFLANQYAKDLAKTENDDHHSFDVIKLPLNQIKDISFNKLTGQHCEQETVFSVTKKAHVPVKEPLLWGT